MPENAAILLAVSEADATPTRRGEAWPDVLLAALERASLGDVRLATSPLPSPSQDPGIVIAAISNAALDSDSYLSYLQALDRRRLLVALREPITRELPDGLAGAPRFDLSFLETASSDDAGMLDRLAQGVLRAGGGDMDRDGVFLASAAPDALRERERIFRELASRGRLVRGAPYGAAREESMRRELERSALSIHLLGGGTLDPLAAEEFRAALEEGARRSDFAQLVWMPAGASVSADADRLLSSAFERAGSGAEIEVLRTGIEDFKTYLVDRLRSRRERASAAGPDGGRPRLYLMFDRRDEAAAGPVEELAATAGLDVIRPTFGADQVAMREHHQRSLRDCDGAMIVYGRVAEPWVRMKQQDLLKAAGFGRTRPMAATAILLAPEPTPAKAAFDAPGVAVVRGTDGITPELLAAFVALVGDRQV